MVHDGVAHQHDLHDVGDVDARLFAHVFGKLLQGLTDNGCYYIYGIFPIKAKIFAAIWVGLALFGALKETGGVANVAHLGGAAFGFLYVRWLPKRGLKLAGSEGYYGFLNRYHKWKRRQAAKKFQVYMGKHNRSQYFDEHGNYREPGNGKGNGKGDDPSKWVN